MNAPFGFGAVATAPAGPGDQSDPDGPNDSLVAQLAGLYQEKQELQAALGASTAAEIIELYQARQHESMTGSLIEQIQSIYAERDHLQHQIGCASADEVLAYVASLKNSIRTLVDEQRRRLEYEASLLSSHERFLS